MPRQPVTAVPIHVSQIQQGTLVSSTWGIWATLATVGALAIHAERSKYGKGFNAALLATIFGLMASNLNIIPSHAPHIHGVVNSFVLPLAVPMLLFSGNLSRVLSTGRLLFSFLSATLATILGSLLACALVPLQSLGPDGHMVAAALTARHIGGSINYVAVTDLLGVSPAARMAGLAADDVIVTLYFVALYTLVAPKMRKLPVGYDDPQNKETGEPDRMADASISVLDGATAISISAVLCATGSWLAEGVLGYKGGSVAVITLLTILFATLAPKKLLTPRLIASGEGIGAILLQIFFASVGASGNLAIVLATAPRLFAWSAVAVASHLGLVLLFERLFRFNRVETCLSSNANIGGPTTAAAMAASWRWNDMIVPAILIGVLGYEASDRETDQIMWTLISRCIIVTLSRVLRSALQSAGTRSGHRAAWRSLACSSSSCHRLASVARRTCLYSNKKLGFTRASIVRACLLPEQGHPDRP